MAGVQYYVCASLLPPCQVCLPLRPSSNLRHPKRERISASTERGKSKTRRTPISIWPPSCIAGSLRRTRQAFWPVQTLRAQIMGLYADPHAHHCHWQAKPLDSTKLTSPKPNLSPPCSVPLSLYQANTFLIISKVHQCSGSGKTSSWILRGLENLIWRQEQWLFWVITTTCLWGISLENALKIYNVYK